MPKPRRTRHQYPPEQRAKILLAAQQQGLTAEAVQKRFGVIPVTYYSWRKKAGVTRPHGTKMVGADALGGGRIQAEVQARIRTLLPALVRSEVSNYLEQAFRSGRRRRVRT